MFSTFRQIRQILNTEFVSVRKVLPTAQENKNVKYFFPCLKMLPMVYRINLLLLFFLIICCRFSFVMKRIIIILQIFIFQEKKWKNLMISRYMQLNVDTFLCEAIILMAHKTNGID